MEACIGSANSHTLPAQLAKQQGVLIKLQEGEDPANEPRFQALATTVLCFLLAFVPKSKLRNLASWLANSLYLASKEQSD